MRSDDAFTAGIQALRTDGLAVVPDFLTTEQVCRLCDLVDPLLDASASRAGVRQALRRQPRIREVLTQTPLQALVDSIAGPGCRVIRAVVFDKSAGVNWMVPWHQDATIAVSHRAEVEGFGPWAIKDQEHHCQPPRDVLESIVTVRLHLDPCPSEAGPLRVIAGSHRLGLLPASALEQVASRGQVIEAVVDRGGAVLTTPLAVHSSRRSLAPTRRRTLHLDCSNATLPGGLRFAEAA